MLALVDDKMSIISSKNIASSFWLIRTPHPKKTENLPHFYTAGVLDFFPFGFFGENSPFCCPFRFHQQPLGGLVQGALASAATETLAASCNFLIGRNFLKDPHATGPSPWFVWYGTPEVLDVTLLGGDCFLRIFFSMVEIITMKNHRFGGMSFIFSNHRTG